MKMSSTLGGLAGACALTLLNEGARKVNKNAPRLDLLGKNVVAKFVHKSNLLPTNLIPRAATSLLPIAIAGDLLSNSLYYGLAKSDSKKQTLLRGALLGIGAGLGAIGLPKPLGLNERYTNRTAQTKALTIAWYVIGGLVAASVINLLESRQDKKAV